MGKAMKIIATSDTHGNLINIKEQCDIFIIAGDWSPLYCQSDPYRMLSWIKFRFIPWTKTINAKYIIFIAGNHDFVCTFSWFNDELNKAIYFCDAKNIYYLNNSSVIINDIKFYGTPNNESPRGWAYAKEYNQVYNFDKDTDVLITHQPPKIGNVGFVKQKNIELGSDILKQAIKKSNITLNICGHIHTGEHKETLLKLNNGKFTRVYNVSLLNEDYMPSYDPTIINI